MELMRLVLERNEQVNLTAITEPVEFAELHLLDSLACVGLPEIETARSAADVGSGAGFPGLPLAALYPGKRFLLTDSLRKRLEFVTFAASSLGLGNVSVLHARAETAGRAPACRERFDLVLCRAVGRLPVILEYCLPFVRVGGAACFYKTVPAEGEIGESRLARELLGGSAEVRVEAYRDVLPERGHTLYLVGKERPTPKSYPRREGIPAKVPL
jgi:16S rRNA (guanine527-N7)-methyltransferase